MSTGLADNNNQAPESPSSTPSTVRVMESQVLANIQNCMTRLEVKLEHLEKTLDKHDGKLDKIGDDVDKLRSWRVAIIAGFSVGAVLISSAIGFVGWSVNKAIDLYFDQPPSVEVQHREPPATTTPKKLD